MSQSTTVQDHLRIRWGLIDSLFVRVMEQVVTTVDFIHLHLSWLRKKNKIIPYLVIMSKKNFAINYIPTNKIILSIFDPKPKEPCTETSINK